jgi:protoheme IX farnesyltransferase
MSPGHALLFGATSSIAGMAVLSLFVNWLAALFAALTLGLYLVVYTPLKRHTTLNTLAGAVPGALPPMIGYAAARGRIDAIAWMLFAILFVWQLPHFLAIAWMYRDDYARAGYRMLAVVDPSGTATGRQSVLFSMMLLAVSLLPALYGFAGPYYLAGGLVLGIAMIAVGLRLAVLHSEASARLVLFASIVYLPVLMILMLLDRTGG